MRDLIKLVEDGLIRPTAWRVAMLTAARQPESMITALHPAETGLGHTVYASETQNIPAVIIDSRSGKQFAPDENALVLAFGEKSGDTELDRWLAGNDAALQAYCHGQFDSIDFYAALRAARRADEAMIRLDEMANFRKGRFNAPIAFWIRPEPNPLAHEARVKCNADYQDAPSNQNFSIRLLPTPSLAIKDGKPHDTGSVKQRDVDGMIRWIAIHQQLFLAFYNGQINQQQLENGLAAQPYS